MSPVLTAVRNRVPGPMAAPCFVHTVAEPTCCQSGNLKINMRESELRAKRGGRGGGARNKRTECDFSVPPATSSETSACGAVSERQRYPFLSWFRAPPDLVTEGGKARNKATNSQVAREKIDRRSQQLFVPSPSPPLSFSVKWREAHAGQCGGISFLGVSVPLVFIHHPAYICLVH